MPKKSLRSIESSKRFGHNRIINALEERLKYCGFEEIEKNHLFSVNFHELTLYGETDLYAFDYDKRIIIATEVKGIWVPETYNTAYMQLIKDFLYFKNKNPDFKIILMYAHGEDNKKGYISNRLKKNEVDYYLKKFEENIQAKYHLEQSSLSSSSNKSFM